MDLVVERENSILVRQRGGRRGTEEKNDRTVCLPMVLTVRAHAAIHEIPYVPVRYRDHIFNLQSHTVYSAV